MSQSNKLQTGKSNTAVSLTRTILAAGLTVELIYIFKRGISAGRVPLLGPHDTLMFFSASIILMALTTSFSPTLARKNWFNNATGVCAALCAGIAFIFPASSMQMPQILDTLWFEAHVALAFFSYALFTIGAILSLGYIIKKERSLLDIQFRVALTGWSFFSASMISGGIWGYYAWGTYWLWTPKELWTSILWLYYSLLLHIRFKGSRGDTLSAWLGIAGFIIMLFTYLGVSLLMKSSHSF
ncbi:MAG: cytochrome c biogenesis protein CcsA [Desulfuromonadaceae bacterium]|nr:cytochrome c biogenesis protein CcsA [Desulfuromonadaceae bacterium]MDD2854213.1 cytochrome c biogenesis protein CcsA [Desulfuromonadaceae bacterium]